MTVTWEHFAGRTDRFALRLTLIEDPDEGEGARPEDAASWGSFQLWVENRNLCTHVDQGEILTATHWYLLPLAEWIAENWNALLHEERLPLVNSADTGVVSLELARDATFVSDEAVLARREQEVFDWRGRHAFRAARQGGLFPNIVMRRLRDYIEISWDSSTEAGALKGFEFSLGRGSVLLEPREIAEPLHNALTELANVIDVNDTARERVDLLRTRLAEIPDPDLNAERSMWLAGPELLTREIAAMDRLSRIDPVALQAHGSSLVVERASPVALLFASLSPQVTEADIRTLSALLVNQYDVDAVSRLDSISEDVPLHARRRPWQQGYELAEMLHEELQLDARAGWIDVEDFLVSNEVKLERRPLADEGVAACSILGPHYNPAVIINTNRPSATNDSGLRFTLAHELCHLLYDRAAGADLALASGPWAPRGLEQRARAFAAMFLLPPHLLETSLGALRAPVTTVEGLSELAAGARVSRTATVWHLSNVGVLSDIQRAHLLEEFDR